MGHKVTVATTQLCCYSVSAAIDHAETMGTVGFQYTWTDSWIWPRGHVWPTTTFYQPFEKDIINHILQIREMTVRNIKFVSIVCHYVAYWSLCTLVSSKPDFSQFFPSSCVYHSFIIIVKYSCHYPVSTADFGL